MLLNPQLWHGDKLWNGGNMYCPSCGKSIPAESKFCLHCGTSIAKPQSRTPAIVPSDEVPTYIKNLAYWENDIKDSKGRFGFGISFILLDKALRATRYDGELDLRVNGSNSFGSKFKRKIQITKDDFRGSAKDPNWYGYVFEHPEPIINAAFPRNYVDIEFLPKGGKQRLKASTWR